MTLSQDGKTLAFDMLGDIYAVPADGRGEATALASGITWNYQLAFAWKEAHQHSIFAYPASAVSVLQQTLLLV